MLLLALLFRTIESFNMFDLIYTITNGGPGTSTESVSTEIYDTAFVLFESGRASALGNISVFVVIVLTRLYFQGDPIAQGDGSDHGARRARHAPARRLRAHAGRRRRSALSISFR